MTALGYVLFIVGTWIVLSTLDYFDAEYVREQERAREEQLR